MPSIKCPRCRRSFVPPSVPRKGGKVYCRDCTRIISRVNILENSLIEREFSLEKEDEQLARQIHDIIAKEGFKTTESDEELLTALTEKMLKDDARRRRILAKIRELQRAKG